MFKNPLKYQQGGTAPTQEQQKLLAAFIEWLPKRVKEFQGMQPEAIAKALDGMSKTPEGQKQVQQLMEQFQQEMQGGQPAFRNGGKIHDFICKHAKGGAIDCGCGGIKIQKGQSGLQKVGRGLRTVMRTTPIGKYLLAPEKNEGYRDAEWGSNKLPDMNGIVERRGGVGRDINGNPVYYLGEVVNGTSADSYYFPDRNIIEQHIAGEPDQIIRTYQPGSYEYESVYNRFKPLIPSNQNGGDISRKTAFSSAKTNDEGNVGKPLLRQTYRGLKNQFRNEGLRGREMRQAARTALMSPSIPDLNEIVVEDIALPEIPQVILSPDKPMNVTINPYVENLDKYSFGEAFNRSRRAGNKNFKWNGNIYNTLTKEELASQQGNAAVNKNTEVALPNIPVPEIQNISLPDTLSGEKLVINDNVPHIVIPEYNSKNKIDTTSIVPSTEIITNEPVNSGESGENSEETNYVSEYLKTHYPNGTKRNLITRIFTSHPERMSTTSESSPLFVGPMSPNTRLNQGAVRMRGSFKIGGKLKK